MIIDNKFLFFITGAIALYAIFLIISDFNAIYNKLHEFKLDYLPIILVLIPISWLVLFTRWGLLLKNSNINVPVKENLKIYLVGFAFTVIPGKVGELIRSQILKTRFGIPRKNTAPIVLVEQLYNVIGIVVVSIIGMWYFEFSAYILSIVIILLLCVIIILSSKKILIKFLPLLNKIKYISKYTDSLSDSYDVIKKSTKGLIAIYSVILSTAFWFIESIIVYFVLLSLGIEQLELLTIIPTYTTSIVLGIASFLPMGIGVVEGSLAGFLTLQGIEFSIALTSVILIRIFTRWIAVSVGFVSLKLSKALSTEKI